MLSAKEEKLLEVLAPRAEKENVEIVTLEIVGSKKAPTICVYIDTPEGVSFDQLSSAQAWINEIMDEVDPFPGAYTLEVSSPGIDRPLRTEEHFVRFVGQTAKVTTTTHIEGRSAFKGIIKTVENGVVSLDVDGTVYELPISDMKRARLRGEIDFNSKN